MGEGERQGMAMVPFDGGIVAVDLAAGRMHALNPAGGFVWAAHAAGATAAEIADALAEAHGLDPAAARADVDAVLTGFAHPPGPSARAGDAADDIPDGPEADRGFDVAGTRFRLSTACAAVMHHVGTVLAPYVRDDVGDAPVVMVRRESAGLSVAAGANFPRRVDTVAEAVGAVFQCVIDARHPGLRWLAHVHGAAVSRGGGAVVLAGASGSGKSTLAAFLGATGFGYLADDLVALSAPGGLVVPWPVPHSLKHGSWNVLAQHYPELANAPDLTLRGRGLRQAPGRDADWDAPSLPVRALVFPTYRAGAAPSLVPVPPMQALVGLMADRVHLGHPLRVEAVEAFLGWLATTPAYALAYGDLSDAELLVAGLLPA